MAGKEIKMSSPDSSDREQDTFEDAPDTASRPVSSASVRSLTGESVITPRPSNAQPPTMDFTLTSEGTSTHTTGETRYIEPTPEPATKSPLLTAHRISTSSLDEVQLGDVAESGRRRSRSSTITSNDIAAPEPAPEPSPAATATKAPARSHGLPNLPWGQSPAPKVQTPPAPSVSAPPPRKLAGPFSWLSRSSSSKIDTSTPAKTPTAQIGRRNTASSVGSANAELMLSRLDEGNESDGSNVAPGSRRNTRNSLRDRFKLLRMREEAGIQSLEGQEPGSPGASGGALAGLIGRSASIGFGIGSPTSVADEKERGLAGSPVHSPASVRNPSVDSGLPPGTASGASAGPSAMSDPAAPVDWDLWQSVVYEGPAAVARTSAEELNQAIASGIPSAIRGVVWQVLAQSKNEELEGVYRELVVRGTDKDRDVLTHMQNGKINGHVKEKTPVASSASSIHSEHSTAATPATDGMTSPSPSQERDNESIAKLQAAMLAERKKKSKEDTAALQKLEKVIKRDLGARTSYSKYAAAAGLQEGLFGVCKAYALFDEGVGYAQGMNFLVMPLLFNVSHSLRATWHTTDS